MTFSEAEVYLNAPLRSRWKLDLSRMERLCELAGHPERQFRSVLVAGSAGKGSTCAMVASMLQACGLRVGSSPKPHLFSFCERAQINGVSISEERFAALMTQIVPLAEQTARELDPPTVFEVLTLLTFMHFAAEQVDIAIVEVGLGGRFDATNVLEPIVAIITSIGLDHTDWLGDTVEKIAFEKAGIIKPGVHVISGAEGTAQEVIETVCRERGVKALWSLGKSLRIHRCEVTTDGTTFDLGLPGGSAHNVRIPLVGEHQARNASLALAAVVGPIWKAGFPLLSRAVDQGLADVSIPIRLQVVRETPLVLLDAAHSPDRARALVQTLTQVYLRERPARPVVFVIGCSKGHAPSEVVSILAELADQVVATKSEHPAAIPAAEIAAAVVGKPVESIEPVGTAVARATELAGEDGVVVATGSLFVAAEALGSLRVCEN